VWVCAGHWNNVMALLNTDIPLGLISLNTNGMGDKMKLKAVSCWLKDQQDADTKIILLQETHTTERIESLWEAEWGDSKIYFSHGSSGSKGVATIIPKKLDYEITNITRSKNGRYIAINITIEGNQFCIINCYAPNCNKLQDQLKWLEEIQKIIEANSELNIIIGGDLNDVFNPRLDRYLSKPNALTTEYIKAWKTVCEEYNLADFWRVLNPETRRYTWRQGSSATRLKQSRIDYWIVSLHLMYNLDKVDISSSMRSDHSLIELSFFKSKTPKRGPSFWQFNASLLRDNKYVEQIKKLYTDSVEKYKEVEDLGLKWDLIKMEIRSTSICFSKTKAKETRENIKEKVLEINQLEKQISTNPTDEILTKYNESKKYIEEYNNEKAHGVFLRSKVNWVEYGEKNSKFFLNV
jgi:exonuclease III